MTREELARALAESMGVPWLQMGQVSKDNRKALLSHVDAILTRLAEPSEDMLGAGLWAAAPDERDNEDAMKMAWQAMLKAIK